MTRRKPLSKRITALSLARNLTSKQEHQLVAMADRARHLEADLAAAQEREERIRADLSSLAANYQVRADSSPTPLAQWRDVAADVRRILDGRSEFEQELIEAMSKPIGTPAEQAATNMRAHWSIEEMGRRLRDQEKEPS